MGQQIIQFYELSQDRVHLERTIAALYLAPARNPLVAYGQNGDHPPDLLRDFDFTCTAGGCGCRDGADHDLPGA